MADLSVLLGGGEDAAQGHIRRDWGQGRCRAGQAVEHLPLKSAQVCYAAIVAVRCISSVGVNATLCL